MNPNTKRAEMVDLFERAFRKPEGTFWDDGLRKYVRLDADGNRQEDQIYQATWLGWAVAQSAHPDHGKCLYCGWDECGAIFMRSRDLYDHEEEHKELRRLRYTFDHYIEGKEYGL